MKRKNSRPRTEINWEKVNEMLMAGGNGTQIAATIGIHPDTLYRHVSEDFDMTFTAYSQEKRAKGDMGILIAQYDEAVRKRDRGMLIWLGKNRLGQSEKEVVEHTGQVPLNIVSYNGKELKPWKETE